MVSGVIFGLDNGNTLLCPDSSLLIFIDETGHEGLSDQDFLFFGYGGCLTYAGEYENAIGKPWKVVEQAFPSDMFPLHASELKPDHLTDPQKAGLNSFFVNNVFGRFAAICSNKNIRTMVEAETIFYMIVAVGASTYPGHLTNHIKSWVIFQ